MERNAAPPGQGLSKSSNRALKASTFTLPAGPPLGRKGGHRQDVLAEKKVQLLAKGCNLRLPAWPPPLQHERCTLAAQSAAQLSVAVRGCTFMLSVILLLVHRGSLRGG